MATLDNFSLISLKTYTVTFHLNHLRQAAQMWVHNVIFLCCFSKTYPLLPQNTPSYLQLCILEEQIIIALFCLAFSRPVNGIINFIPILTFHSVSVHKIIPFSSSFSPFARKFVYQYPCTLKSKIDQDQIANKILGLFVQS